MRNYEEALNAKGSTVRFFCRGAKECAPAGSTATLVEVGNGQIGMPTTWDTTVYLLAERDGPEGRVTVGMLGVETNPFPSSAYPASHFLIHRQERSASLPQECFVP